MFNANNYGYNPTGRYVPQYMEQPQPTYMPQPQLVKPTINGKQVDSLEVVRATDIGLSGETFYFPLTDNSAIITKQIGIDGTSKITIYKPITEQKEEIRYITREDMESALNDLNNEEIEDIKDELKEIKQELKDLKKKKKED